MTFATVETSVSGGRPVELLQIDVAAQHWYYTTAEESITYNSIEFHPLPIERDPIKPTGDTAKAGLNIKVPHDTPIGDMFRSHPPSDIIIVTLFAEHYGDNDFKVIWKGRAINADWSPPWLTLTTESVISSLSRVGLRRKYSGACPFVLYGGECGVSQDSFKHTLTVGSISGSTVVFPGAIGLGDNYFAGGFVQWLNASRGTTERRYIKSSASSTGAVLLSSTPFGMTTGQSVSVYAGCDHTLATCIAKFGNSLNYGGTPYIPTKNPFGGSTIY